MPLSENDAYPVYTYLSPEGVTRFRYVAQYGDRGSEFAVYSADGIRRATYHGWSLLEARMEIHARGFELKS